MRVSGVTYRPIEDANLVSSMALLARSDEAGLAVTNFLDLAKTMARSNPARGELVRR
jgi:hypothetical protein